MLRTAAASTADSARLEMTAAAEHCARAREARTARRRRASPRATTVTGSLMPTPFMTIV